jgi:hypothetical protein
VFGFRRRSSGPVAAALALGILMAMSPGWAAAQSGDVAATECCLSLLFPIGARTLALGSAVNARPDGSALFMNPALLATLESDEFFVHNLDSELDKTNTFTLLIRSSVAGSFAISYRHVDYGEQEATTGGDIPIGTIARYEQVLVATYATPVAAGLNAGVSYKLYQDRLDCRGFSCSDEYRATTHGVDLGAQFQSARFPALSVGASIVHLGFPLQVKNRAQSDPPPARLRLGAAYEVLHHFRPDSTVKLMISADVVDSWRALGNPLLNVGSELSYDGTIFLWLGHAAGTGLFTGLAVGLGLKYDRFDLGIARSLSSVAAELGGDAFQITFGLRF